MKSPAPILACALAAALVVPSLLAALSACAMADCAPAMSARPVMPAAGHDCCPPAATAIAADCCEVAFESPAASPKVPEPLGAASGRPSTVLAMLPPDLRVAGRLATLAASRPPLDFLAQGCILRI